MPEIDLQDLPLALGAAFEQALAGEPLAVLRGGRRLGRLAVVEEPSAADDDVFARLAPEAQMAEVFGEFEAEINEEF